MALNAYNSPGVTVSESVTQSLAPLLANPSVVALIGSSSGKQTASERIILTGTTPVVLRYTGVDPLSVVVLSATDGSTVNPGNYTVAQGADPNTGIAGDEPWTITRISSPASPPSVTTGTGTLTGTYHYAYSYVSAAGETGIGPQSSDIVLTAQGASLSAIAVGPAGTTARNVYREKSISGAGQGWRLVATISDNVTTVLANESTSDSTAGNNASPPTGIATGATVVVTYSYTDDTYYTPTTFADYNDIVDKYGAPFDANGNIGSPLTFAARLIFLNGASELVCVAAKSSAQADYDAALALLENEQEVRFVATASGTSSNNNSVTAHVNKMVAQGYYRQAVVGIDGTNSAITVASQRSAAQAFNNEAIQMVNSTSFQTQNPVTSRPLNVGGQYMAAAITGMWAGRDVQFPLTRKTVAGFQDVNDKRTASEAALDSSAGLIVVENRGGVIRIRHSVTTAVGNVNTREGSVVRAKYDMAHRLKTILDSSIVGLVVPVAVAPLMAEGTVVGVLEQLISEGSIQDYSDVKARILSNDPTTLEIRFSYQPSYPINNINVIFTINTQTGEFVAAT